MAINWLLLISTTILLPRQASSLRSTLPMIRSSLTALERSAMTTKIKNYRHNVMKMTSTSTTASTSFLLKPWPKTMVESRGDYREEEFLEKCIGGPLYEHQATLPRLPVLQVNDTIQKLVPTVLPLSSSPEQSSSFVQKATSFEQQSQHLQQRLITRASTEYKNSSWLQHWWNVLGYLKVRDSVVINVSYFFHLADDATLPLVASSSDDKMILRAACVLHAVANHRLLVCSGGLPQETIGKQKQPLCSVAFKYMFHSCRIPRRDADTYRMYDPSRYKHVIVARKGRYYTMNFVDEKTDQPLPLSVLTSQLQQIINEEATTGTTPIQLGWLTTQDRDSWADAREELLSIGGVTAKDALDKLESGAILLCLDEEEPVSRMQCGKHFLHGSSASANNRWFDKSIQIVCCKNGKVGLVGEHSMIDGMPMVGLADRITKTTYASIIAAGGDDKKDQSRSASGGVHDIFADCEKLWTGTQVEKSIEKAKEKHCAVIDDQHLHVQSFQAYGADAIKKMGYSPDAFAQMAMQLATYRLWGGELGATYEASQVRIFLHGRTETTRSVSQASAAFCSRMGLSPSNEDTLSRAEKVALLQAAIKSHVAYMSDAAKGKGVDRHLLGLSLSIDPNTEKTPALLIDPLYLKAKTWRVSTSHLTHPRFVNWGFGQVVPHGVGIAYSVQRNSCIFNLTALKKWDWTEKLSYLLEEALLEMRDLHSDDGAPPQLGSKL